MEVLHQGMNPIVMYLKKKLEEIEANNVLKLRLHKKKAIMFALPNLPGATDQAFTIPNIRKGFIYTGQLDAATTSVPSFINLLNTLIGNIEGTCLSDRKGLIEKFFEEMYLYGTIKENMFDSFDIPVDVDSKGKPVLKTNDISRENQHRAKILTSKAQIKERQMLVNSKRVKNYEIKNVCMILNKRIML